MALCNLIRHEYALPKEYQVSCGGTVLPHPKSFVADEDDMSVNNKCPDERVHYLQNFDSITHVTKGQEGFYGGSVSLADHCPYIQEFTWRSKNVTVRGSQCQFEDNNPSK